MDCNTVHSSLDGVIVHVRRLVFGTLTIALAGAFALPSTSAEAAATSSSLRPMGNGTGGGDNNGNGSSVLVGRGRRNTNEVTIGSLKSGRGIEQATISVRGAGVTQGSYCTRRSRACNVPQYAWVPFTRGGSRYSSGSR
ncbi:hypothetical protein ACQP1K_28075 [Sphaerimonospora sp. CA-214678]|uniref:hypothetical protein n=1 Tax=Sphaerimonospora sp. CA-214678 TaxID=3240029 RepID=UPI003D9327B2